MSKKTQAKNAMKPTPEQKDQKPEAAKAQEDAAAEKEAAQASAADTAGEGVTESNASEDPQLENPPSPDERQADTGTKQDSQATKVASAKAHKTAAGQKNKVDEVAVKTAADYDLSKPEEVAELAKSVIDDLVSFGHPVRGALDRKPKVQESWNELVKKAQKLQGAMNNAKA